MIKYLRLSFLSLSLIALFISCSDSPTSVGENLIPDQDKIKFSEYDSFLESTPQQSYTYQEKLKYGSSEKVLLGKTSLGESYIVYKFFIYMPDSLLTKLANNELTVTSAKMEMKSTYKLGATGAPFDYSVHQIRKAWTEDGFDKDTLKTFLETSQYDLSDVSSNRVIAQNDSLLKFDLSTQVVTDWLKAKKDSNFTRNYGLLFKPKAGTNRFFGFDAVYTDGTSTNILLKIKYKWGTSTVHNDSINVAPFWDVHALLGAKPVSENHIYLQGSIGVRSVLSFDISKLPKNIILNKATLELTVDDNPAQTSDGTPASDSITVQTLKDSVAKELTSDSLYFAYLKRTGNIYSGDIAWMVQKWIKGDANQGIILALPDENYSASRIAIYNSKVTDKALRPRLKLIYTIK
ncbi:MAG: hypothetical protein FD178_2573 [Ignavibacteria bacterium]|nr:MAG: hypothetical protein FD178_2573 [Ignavibacteria bacterium]